MTLDELLTQFAYRYHAITGEMDTLTIYKRLLTANKDELKRMQVWLQRQEEAQEYNRTIRKDDFFTAITQTGVPERTAGDWVKAKELNDEFFKLNGETMRVISSASDELDYELDYDAMLKEMHGG